jgi:hypothetical protein
MRDCVPNVASYAPLVQCLCKLEVKRAFSCVREILERGVIPDSAIWLSLVENSIKGNQNCWPVLDQILLRGCLLY